MPKDELCQELLQKIDYPLPSTSVNLEGQPSLNSIEKIQETFKNENIYLLNKNTKKDRNISSTIIICENEKVNVLREGSISKQDILNVLKS